MSNDRVSIPNKQRVRIIVEDPGEDVKTQAQKWQELGEAILACDEELSGEPVRVQFRTPEEIEAL
jgi:hypothetical protein